MDLVTFSYHINKKNLSKSPLPRYILPHKHFYRPVLLDYSCCFLRNETYFRRGLEEGEFSHFNLRSEKKTPPYSKQLLAIKGYNILLAG